MEKPYSLSLKTPQGGKSVETDRWDVFVSMMLTEAASIINSHNGGKEDSPAKLDDLASQILRDYHARYRGHRNTRTRIAQAGLELDLVRCYLREMRIVETVEWLENHKGFQTSKSVVARYWKNFYDLGIDIKRRD